MGLPGIEWGCLRILETSPSFVGLFFLARMSSLTGGIPRSSSTSAESSEWHNSEGSRLRSVCRYQTGPFKGINISSLVCLSSYRHKSMRFFLNSPFFNSSSIPIFRLEVMQSLAVCRSSLCIHLRQSALADQHLIPALLNAAKIELLNSHKSLLAM